MPCDSRDSETHHWWLKEGVMTILSFCALFPLLHVFSLQLSQHSHNSLLSFSMCSSSFPCCGGIACTFRPGYATHLSIYVQNLKYTEVNSYLRFSPLTFLFDSIRNTYSELFRLFHALSPTGRISVKLLLQCIWGYSTLLLTGSFNFPLPFYILGLLLI